MATFPPIKIERDPQRASAEALQGEDQSAFTGTGVTKKKRKLTREERKELEKQKALLEKQKQLEQKKQHFRDHLERELKYTEVTYKRASADWEAMCGAIKLKELQDDMVELWQTLNRALDNKSSSIRRLLNELDIAEEQYQRNFSKHVDVINYLTKLFLIFVDITRKAYEQDAVDLVADFQEDINEKNEIHAARKRNYENILHATNLLTANILDNMQTRHTTDVNELLDTLATKRLKFRDLAVRNMKLLQTHTEKIIGDLQVDALNPQREHVYNQLIERQERTTKEMEANRQASKELSSVIVAQQRKLLSTENHVNTEIVKLRGERSYFVEYYWQLKQRRKRQSKGHEDHIKCLAFEANRTKERLKRIVKFGELVLSLASCCRKFQTEKEKVSPWTEAALVQNLEANKQAEDTQEQHDMDQVRLMHLFWNRVGQTETQVLCLREEKLILEKENENFREIIKSYGDAVAYNKIICSLRISPLPTATIPIQEASQMPQLQRK